MSSEVKRGILRVDSGKSKSSAITVVEPTSPQPSVDRLSVSFANDDKKVDSACSIKTTTEDGGGKEEEEEEEEYSASAQVILERRQDSWRRRGSAAVLSPTDRRRSSVFTSTSETGGSLEEAANQNLRIHKEVVGQIKFQPWPIRRKLRLVHQAKSYIKLHEGQIQERLAQKKSTRDILAHSKIVFLNYWNYMVRELCNIADSLSPWESRIKEIESHFGSAVASYFTFHRWLTCVNLKISFALLVFVILPEILFASNNPRYAGDRKCMLKEEAKNSQKFLTLWNFEGILKHSPIFYGYYNSGNTPSDFFQSRLPFFYFVTGMGLYIYSFVAILRKMAENSRQSKLTEKDEYYIFTWKMFTSWDFMIGNPETANNRTSSIILGFKEALLEEAEKSRDEKRNWKLFSIRILTHLSVLCLLISSVILVIVVVSRSQIAQAGKNSTKSKGWWGQNEVTIVITLIGMIYPLLFDVIGLAEKYHPRKALRLQLARIMVLNLLNLYAFILATFTSIHTLSSQSCQNMPTASDIEHYNKLDSGGAVHSLITTPGLPAPADLLLPKTEFPLFVSKLHDPSQENNGFKFEPHENSIYSQNNGSNGFFPINYSPKLHAFEEINSAIQKEVAIIQQIDHINNSTNFPDLNYISLGETSPSETLSAIQTSTEIFNTESTTLFSLDTLASSVTDDDNLKTSWSLSTSDTFSTTRVKDTSWSPPLGSSTGSEENTTSISSEATFSSTEPRLESASEDKNPLTSTSDYVSTDISPISTLQSEISSLSNKEVFITPDNNVSDFNTYLTLISTFITNGNKSNWNFTSRPTSTTDKESGQFICEQRALIMKSNSDYSPYTRFFALQNRTKIHAQCWETMFGQELVKLTVMDLAMTIMSILLVDFFRAIFVRYMNGCWFWNLEKNLPGYGDFKIAENILHLVNNQGMVWMGMFFSPGLPLINVLKLILLMYVRSWAVLTCNVPHEVVFKASKSNNFYFGLLLTMLFLCVLPVGFALVWIDTSWHCGPFSKYNRIYYVFTYNLPKSLQYLLNFVASPGIVIPLLVLLILIIYYLLSLTSALREANEDLKIQLRTERTEERRKVFQMANKKKKGIDNSESAFNKWCQAINSNGSAKTSVDFSYSIAPSEKSQIKPNTSTTNKEKREEHKTFIETDESLPKGEAKKPANGDEIKGRKNSLEDVFRGREDSVISVWSVDNIPEIRISQSDSFDGLSKRSRDTYSQSKSSSKETIINIDAGEADDGSDSVQDDVFLPNVEGPQSASEKNLEDTENDSIVHGDSYESISKSLVEVNEIGREGAPGLEDQSRQSRKNLAKILVQGLKKK